MVRHVTVTFSMLLCVSHPISLRGCICQHCIWTSPLTLCPCHQGRGGVPASACHAICACRPAQQRVASQQVAQLCKCLVTFESAQFETQKGTCIWSFTVGHGHQGMANSQAHIHCMLPLIVSPGCCLRAPALSLDRLLTRHACR